MQKTFVKLDETGKCVTVAKYNFPVHPKGFTEVEDVVLAKEIKPYDFQKDEGFILKENKKGKQEVFEKKQDSEEKILNLQTK